MKFGVPPKKEWHCAQKDINTRFNPLSKQLNRLMMLDYVWTKLTGEKSKFWVLRAVQKDTLFVEVRVSVARNELNSRKQQLITELNKYFQTPWIRDIKIR